MSKVYGFCKAGCKYPVVKEDEFLKAAAFVEVDNVDVGKKYKIFEKTNTSIKVNFKVDYRGNISDKSVVLTIPAFDKYDQVLKFHLCDIKIGDPATTMTITYDVNGERKTQTYNTGDQDASVVDGTVVCEVVNADKIYLLNETGGYNIDGGGSADLSDYYTKKETEDYVDGEINDVRAEMENRYVLKSDYNKLVERVAALENIPVYNGEVE